MADQVSPTGGLSAGLAQNLQVLAAPPQPKPAQSTPVEVQTQAEAKPTSSDERDKALSNRNLETAAKSVEDYLQQSSPDLKFGVDKDTGIYTISLVDSTTHKVIRQVPAEETLEMARRLRALNDSNGAPGLLMDAEG